MKNSHITYVLDENPACVSLHSDPDTLALICFYVYFYQVYLHCDIAMLLPQQIHETFESSCTILLLNLTNVTDVLCRNLTKVTRPCGRDKMGGTQAFARQLEPLRGRIRALATDPEGPVVHRGRLNMAMQYQREHEKISVNELG